MPRAQIVIRGHVSVWSFDQELPMEEIERMRADGLPVNIVRHEEDVTDEEAARILNRRPS